MFPVYLAKRLLSIIPALLVLSILIFVLRSALPDGIVERYVNQSQLQNSGISSEQLEQLAREVRADLGLDKPLFYFSFQSSVLPDTLHLIYPIEDRRFIEDLLLHYGCPAEVSNYYRLLGMTLHHEQSRALSNALHYKVSERQIGEELKRAKLPEDDLLVRAFEEMRLNRSTIRPYLPQITWHGGDNQFHAWIGTVITLDFGRSVVDNQLVLAKVGRALINTLWITLPAFLLLLVIGIVVGVLLFKSKPIVGRPLFVSMYALDAMPTFWISIILIILFAGQVLLNIFPIYGMGAFGQGSGFTIFQRIPYLVLPVTALVLSALGYVTLQVFKAIDTEDNKLYVMALKARGIEDGRILWVHILKNSLVPIITIYSGYLTAVFAGSLVVEVIFSIPGMGKLLYDSVLTRDYNVVIALVLMVALVKMIANLLADIGYKVVDPSIKY